MPVTCAHGEKPGRWQNANFATGPAVYSCVRYCKFAVSTALCSYCRRSYGLPRQCTHWLAMTCKRLMRFHKARGNCLGYAQRIDKRHGKIHGVIAAVSRKDAEGYSSMQKNAYIGSFACLRNSCCQNFPGFFLAGVAFDAASRASFMSTSWLLMGTLPVVIRR